MKSLKYRVSQRLAILFPRLCRYRLIWIGDSFTESSYVVEETFFGEVTFAWIGKTAGEAISQIPESYRLRARKQIAQG